MSKLVMMTEITDDNRDDLVKLALSMYLGEKCKYCQHEYKTLDELYDREVVFAGYHEHGRCACKSCWDKRNGNGKVEILGVQTAPDDPRIFNRKQPDGSYRPLSEFFDREETK